MAALRIVIACLLLAVPLGGCAKAVKQATKMDQAVSKSLYRVSENLRKRIQDDQEVIDGNKKTWQEEKTAAPRVYCYKTLGELDCYNQELPGAHERLVYTGDEQPAWGEASSGSEWQTSTTSPAAAPSLKPMEAGANWTVSHGGSEVSAGQYQKFKQPAAGGAEAPKQFPDVEQTAVAKKPDPAPAKPRELIAKP